MADSSSVLKKPTKTLKTILLFFTSVKGTGNVSRKKQRKTVTIVSSYSRQIVKKIVVNIAYFD